MKTIAALILALSSPLAWSDTFKGYQCTKDCSGDKARHVWAERKGVTKPEQCTGKSHTFVEGCLAWVEGK